MLNYLWAAMLGVGIGYGVMTGNAENVANGALDCAGEAVELCIAMIGVMALWMGLMEIAQKSCLIAAMTKGIQPFLNFLFPRIPRDHPAREYIATNLIANLLGLGWACTPAGLKAMEALGELEEERRGESRQTEAGGRFGKRIHTAPYGTASKEMCTFLILNISSLQLIPINMIAYRSQYGSASPTAIVGPAIAATAFSTAVAILFCKFMDRQSSYTFPER